MKPELRASSIMDFSLSLCFVVSQNGRAILKARSKPCQATQWLPPRAVYASEAGARYACLLKLSLLHSRFVFSDPDPIKHLRPEQYRARKQARLTDQRPPAFARGTLFRCPN